MDEYQQQTPSPQHKKSLYAPAVLGFIFSIFLPPLGLALAIFSLVKLRSNNQNGELLAILGTIFGAILSIPFLLIMFVFISFGGFRANSAEENVSVIQQSAEEIGGEFICDNGDSGYSISNTRPWYEVYYEIPDSDDLIDELISSDDRYIFTENSEKITQLKNNRRYETSALNFTDYTQSSEYVVGRMKTNNESTIEISLHRDTAVALYCSDVATYGDIHTPSPGNIVLELHVREPDIQR